MNAAYQISFRLLIAAWAGALWFSGFVVAPGLFQALANNKFLAGELAGGFFAKTAMIGLVAGTVLVIMLLLIQKRSALRSATFWVLVVMLILVCINHFGLYAKMMEMRSLWQSDPTKKPDGFAVVHGTASAIHLAISLLAAWLVAAGKVTRD